MNPVCSLAADMLAWSPRSTASASESIRRACDPPRMPIKIADLLFYTQILIALGFTDVQLSAVDASRGSGVRVSGVFVRNEERVTSILIRVRGYTVTVDGVDYQAIVSPSGVLAMAALEGDRT